MRETLDNPLGKKYKSTSKQCSRRGSSSLKQLSIWCASAPYDRFGTLQITTCRTSLCKPMTLDLASSIMFYTAWFGLKPKIQLNSNMHALFPTTRFSRLSKILHTPCFADSNLVSRLKNNFCWHFLKDLAATHCLRTMPSRPPRGSQTLRLDGVHVRGICFIKVSPLYIHHGNEKAWISTIAHIVNVPKIVKTFRLLHILHLQDWN